MMSSLVERQRGRERMRLWGWSLMAGLILCAVFLGRSTSSAADPTPVVDKIQAAPAQMSAAIQQSEAHAGVEFFEPFRSNKFNNMERTALIIVLIVAILGLAYAGMLAAQVQRAPDGT